MSRVSVAMPAEAVLDLEQLIPKCTAASASGKIDLKLLGDNIRTNGITPQQLFTFEDGSKIYRVWLE
jgi:hypothetical protein